MLEFNRRVLEFKLDDVVYSLRYPTVMEINGYQKKLKEEEDHVVALIEFLEILGLKEEVTSMLELEHLQTIVATLTEKKS